MRNGNGNGRRRPRAIPDVLTPEERDKLLGAIGGSSILQQRNALMVRVMLHCGLRSAEVTAIQVRHINFDTGRLLVKNGKGGRDRIVGIPDEDLSLIKQFVSPWGDPDALLFTTGKGKRIDTRFLRAMVTAAGRRAGIHKRLHCHLLRHSMATDLLRKTKNLRVVQESLGHANLATTQIYTRVTSDEVVEAMRNLHGKITIYDDPYTESSPEQLEKVKAWFEKIFPERAKENQNG